MRARRSLVIVLEGRNMLVRGPGSRELLMTVCNGKPPFRSRAANAWTVQAKRLADVLALADRLGYEVTISGDPNRRDHDGWDRRDRDESMRSHVSAASTIVEAADPGEGLW